MSLIWTNAALEPKRKFRYLITFAGTDLKHFEFLAQTCDRPGIKVASAEHKYFDKTYHHPGRVTWDPNPLSIKLVDIQKNGTSQTIDTNRSLIEAFANSGLQGLIANDGVVKTIGKNEAVSALGSVTIRVLNAAAGSEPGQNPANLTTGLPVSEEWVLQNAWLESFKPDSLDYGSDDILTVTMQVRYDWAQFRTGDEVRASANASNPFGPASS
jgi:hypothetical protein